MIEIKGDIFKMFLSLEYDAICSNTNGIVNKYFDDRIYVIDKEN